MLQDVGDRLHDAVEVGVLVVHAAHAALGAGAVVAEDVDDQRVVELTGLPDGVDEPADLGVGVLAEGRVDLHLAGEELLLVGRERAPVLDRLGLRRELRAGRHHAELDLAGESLLAQLVPALVELALVLGDPLLRHVMRRVRRARGEVHEERPIRGHRLLELHPGDRLVGHVGHEVIVRILRHLHQIGAVVESRRPLVGLAADEAVELVEAGARRPAVGRPGDAGLPGRGLVALAVGGGAVAVEAQHLGERRHVVRALAGVARERGGRLGDAGHVVRVVIAAVQQRRARRRADRRVVEGVVAQPLLRQAIGGRHVHRPAESARDAEAHVVDQDEQHVGRALGRLHLEARRRRGVADVELRDRRIARLRDRQHGAVHRRRCRRRRRWRRGRRRRPESAAVIRTAPAAAAASQATSFFLVMSLLLLMLRSGDESRCTPEPPAPSMRSAPISRDHCQGLPVGHPWSEP